MAKKLESLPTMWNHQLYDWDEWLDGSVWELTDGEDYKVETVVFRSQVYTAAASRGGKARTATTDTGMCIQFVPNAKSQP